MPSILITGASRGFGRALFDVYAQRGWTVYPLVRDPLAAMELKIKTDSACHPIVADVATEAVGTEISRVLGKHCESLDLLINNAGHVKKMRGFENTYPEDLEDLFRVHCVGVLRCVRAALPFLKSAKKPGVVNISSRFGSIGRTLSGKGTTVYSYPIAKCAQNMLTACLDQEFREQNIRFFAVHPGRLMTSVGAHDADTEPGVAAAALADWIDRIDGETPCGFHDILDGGLIEW